MYTTALLALTDLAALGCEPQLSQKDGLWTLTVGPRARCSWIMPELDDVLEQGREYAEKYRAYVEAAPACHHYAVSTHQCAPQCWCK